MRRKGSVAQGTVRLSWRTLCFREDNADFSEQVFKWVKNVERVGFGVNDGARSGRMVVVERQRKGWRLTCLKDLHRIIAWFHIAIDHVAGNKYVRWSDQLPIHTYQERIILASPGSPDGIPLHFDVVRFYEMCISLCRRSYASP